MILFDRQEKESIQGPTRDKGRIYRRIPKWLVEEVQPAQFWLARKLEEKGKKRKTWTDATLIIARRLIPSKTTFGHYRAWHIASLWMTALSYWKHSIMVKALH